MAKPSSAASTVQNSSALQGLARVGYAVDGVLHILIGALAIATVVGASSQSADQTGALQTIADQPFGAVLLWIIVAGMIGLALFYLASAITTHGSGKDEWMKRLKSIGKAILYAALAAIAVGVALGSGSSGGGGESMTASLLSNPLGVVLVVLIGLGALGVGVYQIAKGARQKFFDDLNAPTPRTPVKVVGTAGYIAKGIAIATIGVLFIVAAFTHDPSNTAGIDGALKSLAQLPFGAVILVVVALGFVLFGVYDFVRARFARL